MVFLVFINVFYSTVVSSLGYQPPSGWETYAAHSGRSPAFSFCAYTLRLHKESSRTLPSSRVRVPPPSAGRLVGVQLLCVYLTAT